MSFAVRKDGKGWRTISSPEDVTEDEVYSDTIPAPTFDQIVSDKLLALADYRYQRETAGITLNGTKIDTDDRCKILLNSAYTSLKNGFCTAKQWKTEQGWINVTLTEIEPIVKAVDAYIQDCFNNEESHQTAIKALTTIDAVNAYDFTTCWPSQTITS